MFEHFGVRDVFTALWKYVTILIVLLVAAELACVGFHYMKPEAAEELTEKDEGYQVYSSSLRTVSRPPKTAPAMSWANRATC